MRVILTSSSTESPLPGHWPGTHRALLPVCGKAIVIHQIEHLSTHGLKHFVIPRSPAQSALQARLRDGREWGVQVRYSDMGESELIAVQQLNGTETVLAFSDTLDQEVVSIDTNANVKETCKIDSAQAYHHLNLVAIRGQIKLTLPGRPFHEYNARTDWHTDIDPHAYLGSNVFIGKHCAVGTDSRLEGNCILGNGVIVGANARLENVTVLPNTFIKPDSVFKDAVLYNGYVLSLNGSERWSDNLEVTRAPNSEKTGLPYV